MRILVAEDDRLIREGLVEILEGEGYETVEAHRGDRALELFDEARPDLVCLDIMMPGMNGYDVCREIRRRDAVIPVIFISAKSEEIDKVLGLELGADDYITKPFGVREVVARIRAVTRRALASASVPEPGDDGSPDLQDFELAELRVFPRELRARRGEEAIELSLRDVKILRALHEHPGEVLDRFTLYDIAWGEDFFPNSRSLDQHISQLRKRIELDPKEPRIIQTVHGAGYRYDPPPSRESSSGAGDGGRG